MNKNVPKLRFEGFNDKWRATKLGEIIDYKKGFAFKSKDYVDNGVRVIKISDTTTSSVSEEGNTFVRFEMFEEFKEWALKTEDIIISTVGSRPPLYSSMVGKVVKIPEFCNGSLLNQNLVKLVPKDIINTFLYSLLRKTRYTKHIENICRGNANQVSITLEELFDFKVNIPSLQEQEKIADFFTILDSLIEEQDGKVSDLELYKKGMMQKIFSQEIRFKDENGCDYPAWEERKFGEITIKTGPKNKNNEEFTVYSISNKAGFIKQSEQFEDSRLDSLAKNDYKIVTAGDFAYNPARINVGSIGLLEVGQGIVSSLYVCFKFIDGMNNKFFESYFTTYEFNKNVLRNVEGGVREYLFYDNFANIKVRYPVLEEQKKIAGVLSEIDNLIKEEKKNLKDLREMKKGLLQQMFV